MILCGYLVVPQRIVCSGGRRFQFNHFLQMSNEKNPCCLGYIGNEKLPSYYIGITINHSKDPYQLTSIMESRRFFFVAQMGC